MTGFWALDPVGDIRMLFTPNLHEDLALVSSDPTLQKLLSELREVPEGEATGITMKKINRHIYEQGVFNPIYQFRRLFAARSEAQLQDIPLAVQQPYPWQLFGR
jgi:hypothetical protein